MNNKIEKEVALAYSDCHGDRPFEETSKTRNLNFRASAPVSRDEAVRIMKKYVPSYNDFKPSLLKRLPENAQVTISREGSVCLYVSVPVDDWGKPHIEIFEENLLDADECTEVENDEGEIDSIRFWFD